MSNGRFRVKQVLHYQNYRSFRISYLYGRSRSVDSRTHPRSNLNMPLIKILLHHCHRFFVFLIIVFFFLNISQETFLMSSNVFQLQYHRKKDLRPKSYRHCRQSLNIHDTIRFVTKVNLCFNRRNLR